tara:strand:+ start:391 stop:564 length:174 start_codon:yes stop_codon:yes gene_type:complete
MAAVDAVKVPSSIGCPIGRRDNAAAIAVIRGDFNKDVLLASYYLGEENHSYSPLLSR